jgi:predicted transposase YdaD
MAEELHHPHDALVRTVLSDMRAAASFLQAHLPVEVSQGLDWATLRLVDGSFVDEEFRASEADLLYEVEHASAATSLWLYMLVEHQSTPDRWMRLRLLKYCCRIWERQLTARPMPRELRPIVPLVFYQGARSWTYSPEFAELFAEAVRDWPWVPRFRHGLIDQSALAPEDLPGDLPVRLMQMVLLAVSHPERPWEALVGQLIAELATWPSRGGLDYIRIFLRYLLHTQERAALETLHTVLRHQAPVVGEQLMTYAQELRQEGERQGREEGREEGREAGRTEGELRAEVRIIENLLREGMEWAAIARITGIDETEFRALKQRLDALNA